MDSCSYREWMTTPQPPARRPRPIWLWAAAALAVGAAVAVTLILTTGGEQFEYDEAAHQRVIEAYGVTITDWDEYREATFDACEFDQDTFEVYVAMEEDLGRLQLDIAYACPDRMEEFTDITGMEPLD